MNDKNAERLLDDTFGQSYDEVQFLNFINELFNGFDANQKQHLIPNAYRDYIDTEYYKQFGTYIDGSGNAVDVLAIKLKRTTSRDRARTMQRNFVAKHLSEKGNSHAALVAFYDDNPDDWRFSFVKLDYRLERDEIGKVKPVEDLTPAKRYSYLVGINEPNHTCRGQFLELIKNDKINPSIEELESAFSIEKVTKEFFDRYKELYLKLKEALEIVVDNDSRIKDDFVDKEISTVDFAKKLLGQIVFLYFLQKKGWLGVERDGITGKFNEWGSGHKKFLTELVHGRIVDYENRNGNPVNFFNDILEPLFYQALATERDDDYYEIYDYKCKIPFLNGGLFEPINNYNWKETDILLDNSIFTTIIDTFDDFNFTVKEDEPLEKEVAVDPEMLGKVFENLLDVKDRKSKGAFYTPREIVHYMCQQSLINYLEVNTKSKDIPRDDIEKFIRFGDDSSSVDQNHLIKIEELQQRIISGKEDAAKLEEQLYYNFDELTLPKSIKWNKSNRELIDQLLAEIKVVDPAVGSGAFPVGMMNEIVKARSTIALFLYSAKSSDRTTYKLKRETIQNCLYGVDIDSSAVDITKLRFWLSLIVDEDDRDNIEPLPNLDYKIMCGNSLLEEFEGVKLFDEKMLGDPVIDHSFEIEQINSKIDELNGKLNRIYTGKTDDGDPKQIKKQISKLENEKKKILLAPKEKTQQLNLSDAENFKIKQSVRKLRAFVGSQKQFFDTQSKNRKNKLRSEMDNLEWELIEETLKENKDSIQKLQQYKKAKSKPFFLWKLHFAEVFQRDNPGFDVVIVNPPYVGEKGNKEIFRAISKSEFGRRFYNAKMDIFYFFFHKAIDMGRINSSVNFITTNYFITATGAKKLRSDFKNRTTIQKLINFNELKIFDSAKGQHNMITLLQKGHLEREAETSITKLGGLADSTKLNKIMSWLDDDTECYLIKQEYLYDGADNYIRISGTNSKSGAHIDKILNKVKNTGLRLENICNINSGCDITLSKIRKKHLENFSGDFTLGDGAFVLNPKELKELDLPVKHDVIMKNFIKNSNIYPFNIDFSNDKLIYLRWEDEINDYPNIKKHLSKFKEILEDQVKRYDEDYPWFALHRPRDKRIFEASQKIVVPYRNKKNVFGYSEKSVYSSRDVFFITTKDTKYNIKYILGFLNSKLIYAWLYNRGKRKGETLELYQRPLSEIPLEKLSEKQQAPFINLVDQILATTKDEDYLKNHDKQAKVKTLESQIDQLVYKLYDLTPEEIAIVENFNTGK